MKLRTAFVVAGSLLLVSPVSRAEGEEGGDEMGGDGDPGVYDVPPPPLTDPVQIALDVAPRCETAPNWPEVMADVGPDALRTAIEDGTVGLTELRRAIGALAAVGSEDDMRALWDAADDLAWEYVIDAVDPEATDAEVLEAQAELAGSTRRDVLAGWAERGDLPDDILDSGLDDPDPRVRRNAARIALASSDADRVAKGEIACASDPAVASVAYICQ